MKTACKEKKQRVRLNAAQLNDRKATPSILSVEVPGTGGNPSLCISMVAPVHPCHNVCIKMDEDTIEHVVLFIRGRGIEVLTLTQQRE